MKKKRKLGRKLLSFLLTLAMVIGLMPGMSITAYADQTPVPYLDDHGEEKTCNSYTVVTSSNSTIEWVAGWYVVNADVTINGQITFSGDVHLILCDGATLMASNSIKKSSDTSNANLTIYGQSEGTGALNVTSNSTSAIDNHYTDTSTWDSYGGNIKINGGKITASATGTNGHGIFAKGDITINGGEVNAEAIAESNAGIWASGGTVTINGGKITAKVTNGESYGTGINGSDVIISDGEVIAVGNYRAIGGNVKNEIAGTGWTNTDGTEGKANIAVSDTARELSDYKKMRFTAAKDDITASADSITATYDGKAHGITVSVTVPASGATIKYGKTEGTYDLTSSPTITDVKDSPLTVYYKVTADGYNDLTGSATVTISKANAVAATVTANTRTYDETDKPLVTVDNSTLVGGTMYYALGTATEAAQPYTTAGT